MSKIWAKIVAAFSDAETKIDEVFTEIEKALLPGFEALCKQIEETLGKQGIEILKDGLADIATVIASGGDVGLIIKNLVPQVTTQVETALKQDATNAAQGAVALIVAQSSTIIGAVSGTLDSAGNPTA